MEFTFWVSTQDHYGVGDKRKACDAAPLCNIMPAQKKRGPGRPPNPTPKKRRPPRKAQTMLRRDRPVETSVPMDIWENVLSFSSLERLLKLREICSTFHSALSRDAVWRTARLRQFGPDHPPPPNGLTEMQYADLLVGIGCHGAGCDAKETRRTYWAFRRRWCETCLGKNLVRGRQAKEDLYMPLRTSRCLPQARYDSWGHYQWAGSHDNNPGWTPLTTSQSVAYSKFDIREINRQVLELEARHCTDEEIDEWFTAAEARNSEFVQQLQKVEEWVESDRKVREQSRVVIRDQRVEFFREKAAQMSCPLTMDALELCDSYLRSIRIAKPPSKKSWQKLMPKLEEERIDAELRAERFNRERYHRHYRMYLRANSGSILARRAMQDCPEQRLVLNLADQVIRELNQPGRDIHPNDFVCVIMRGVHAAYQELSDDEKPPTRGGPYRLIMDDARLVYYKKIVPEACRRYHLDQQVVPIQVRCPVWSCRQSGRKHEFHGLQQHIYDEHRYGMGFEYLLDTVQFYGESLSVFPWYRIEWPRNLPMLAQHHSPQDSWDIDAVTPYVYAPVSRSPASTSPAPAPLPLLPLLRSSSSSQSLEPAKVSGTASAARRILGTSTDNPDVAADSRLHTLLGRRPHLDAEWGSTVAETMRRALDVIRGAPLIHLCRLKTAFEFVNLRMRHRSGSEITLQDLQDLRPKILREGPVVDKTACLTCNHCARAAVALPSNQHEPNVFTYANLIEHWYSDHWNVEASWEIYSLVLPSSQQLKARLERDVTRMAWESFTELFPLATATEGTSLPLPMSLMPAALPPLVPSNIQLNQDRLTASNRQAEYDSALIRQFRHQQMNLLGRTETLPRLPNVSSILSGTLPLSSSQPLSRSHSLPRRLDRYGESERRMD